MVENINFLLVGNSRFHWAKNLNNKYKFFHTDKNNKVPQNINLDNLIWAAVGKLPDFCLKQENEIITKHINLKNLPHYFGVDIDSRLLYNFITYQINCKRLHYRWTNGTRISYTVKVDGAIYKKS